MSRVELVERDLARARAETDAAVKLREVSLLFDQRSLRRVSSLHRDKVVSVDEKEKAEREAKLAGWRLQDAKDLLRQRQLELERSEQVLQRRQVYSPIDGVIVHHHQFAVGSGVDIGFQHVYTQSDSVGKGGHGVAGAQPLAALVGNDQHIV